LPFIETTVIEDFQRMPIIPATLALVSE
jgi:hypothetical protein